MTWNVFWKVFCSVTLCETFAINTEGAHDALPAVGMCVALTRALFEKLGDAGKG